MRENLFTGKLTAEPPAMAITSPVRYGYDGNSSPSGAGLRAAHSTWSTSTNTFHSINASDNWVFGGTKLNEFLVQAATFRERDPGSTTQPVLMFPNSVSAAQTSRAADDRADQVAVP